MSLLLVRMVLRQGLFLPPQGADAETYSRITVLEGDVVLLVPNKQRTKNIDKGSATQKTFYTRKYLTPSDQKLLGVLSFSTLRIFILVHLFLQ